MSRSQATAIPWGGSSRRSTRPPSVSHPATAHIRRVGAERANVDVRHILRGSHIDAPSVEKAVARVAVRSEEYQSACLVS